jgi:hypothetical protein
MTHRSVSEELVEEAATKPQAPSSQRGSMSAPDWLVAEMPPGYQTRFAEIKRLTEELQGMERLGHLLWDGGPALTEAVRDAFAALQYEVELMPDAPESGIAVKLGANRQLLLHVMTSDGPVKKKDPELTRVFQMLHESDTDVTRVVLVANTDRAKPPADRGDSVGPDALAFLSRMGVNVVTTPMVFKLWMLSLQDRERARVFVERLYEQDGGAFSQKIG